MRLSEDKIAHLSHVMFDGLIKDGAAELLEEDTKVRREMKQVITRWQNKEDEVEDVVRKKVLSYSRKILEGSHEWDLLYQKHYDEEMKKRGKS